MPGLLQAGDPRGEVKTAWNGKEEVRNIYRIDNPRRRPAYLGLTGSKLLTGANRQLRGVPVDTVVDHPGQFTVDQRRNALPIVNPSTSQ